MALEPHLKGINLEYDGGINLRGFNLEFDGGINFKGINLEYDPSPSMKFKAFNLELENAQTWLRSVINLKSVINIR